MIHESNSKIQIETTVHNNEIDSIFIVHETKFRRGSSSVEMLTHSEYFMSRGEAERYISTFPLVSEANEQHSFTIQSLTKASVAPRLVFSKAN